MPAEFLDSSRAAKGLETRTEAYLTQTLLPPPREYFAKIRIYLQRMTDTKRTTNGVHLLSQLNLENGDSQINAGPTIFKEPCESIRFRSGAQLSFGITLRSDGRNARLLSYRFYLSLLPASGLRFVRIDLNAPKDDYDPLHVPRCHLHPGFEGIHIPFPVMEPIAVLDRIVHVVEPHFVP